ncbi:hypothetical protein B0H13DRAFT_2367099 [Mycena leptocephala]|nr:hypothetical protein B0H13DRAFT_2367099 [Mycena leptocephala]
MQRHLAIAQCTCTILRCVAACGMMSSSMSTYCVRSAPTPNVVPLLPPTLSSPPSFCPSSRRCPSSSDYTLLPSTAAPIPSLRFRIAGIPIQMHPHSVLSSPRDTHSSTAAAPRARSSADSTSAAAAVVVLLLLVGLRREATP